MRAAQFVFVTHDARVLAMGEDGLLEDVTEARELLPQSAFAKSVEDDPLADKRRELLKRFAS
ncbi:hypothetical protein [Magnetovibrio blakemorei]|uniref:Uncharacterized protein n=1 Tax=Magnetovibrio blakemorei TaxID=28181 RepID=A0A1E5Q8J6_9PROT|nr:hypothetical protein [Magnetovibrio blakemorei]OEJ67706.1 hypothetical protein BEN30_08205 [Magnetovibrio blakemorei]